MPKACTNCIRFHYGKCGEEEKQCFECGGFNHIERYCPNGKATIRHVKGQPLPGTRAWCEFHGIQEDLDLKRKVLNALKASPGSAIYLGEVCIYYGEAKHFADKHFPDRYPSRGRTMEERRIKHRPRSMSPPRYNQPQPQGHGGELFPEAGTMYPGYQAHYRSRSPLRERKRKSHVDLDYISHTEIELDYGRYNQPQPHSHGGDCFPEAGTVYLGNRSQYRSRRKRKPYLDLDYIPYTETKLDYGEPEYHTRSSRDNRDSDAMVFEPRGREQKHHPQLVQFRLPPQDNSGKELFASKMRANARRPALQDVSNTYSTQNAQSQERQPFEKHTRNASATASAYVIDDPYFVLDVQEGATETEIAEAYQNAIWELELERMTEGSELSDRARKIWDDSIEYLTTAKRQLLGH